MLVAHLPVADTDKVMSTDYIIASPQHCNSMAAGAVTDVNHNPKQLSYMDVFCQTKYPYTHDIKNIINTKGKIPERPELHLVQYTLFSGPHVHTTAWPAIKLL